jgi:tetratricopeptide (TPR) repeat protein
MRWIVPMMLVALLLPACGEPSETPVREEPVAAKPLDSEAARLLAEGEALVKSDPDKAIEILTASIEKQETSEAYLARAQAKLANAPMVMPGTIPPDVAPDLAKALELDHTNTSALFFRARMLGIGRRAGRDVLEVILTVPVAETDGVGLFVRARAEAKLAGDLPGRERSDMLKRAVADFAKAAPLLPKHAELRLLWGSLLMNDMGQDEKAEPILKQCVKLDPGGKCGRQAQALLDEM